MLRKPTCRSQLQHNAFHSLNFLLMIHNELALQLRTFCQFLIIQAKFLFTHTGLKRGAERLLPALHAWYLLWVPDVPNGGMVLETSITVSCRGLSSHFEAAQVGDADGVFQIWTAYCPFICMNCYGIR